MFSQKFILPTLAVLGVAAAQSASICSQATATINSQADATQYASCSTIKGDVLVGPTASGMISIDGPQQIVGDVICANAGGLTSLGSTTIGSISGTFNLNNLTILSNLQFDGLSSVGKIDWEALPFLAQLNFATGVSQATSVLITNTFLSTLDGINLETVGTLNINNNNRLTTFSTQVANITQLLNIDSNGKMLQVSFPNLLWAANMTFRNVSSVSLPSLATVNGSLGFYENYFTGVMFPNLTSVGSTSTLQGSLAFVANPMLGNVTMPVLKTIGGANQIANNSALTNISFPVLTTVGGAIDFSGNFSTPDLGALTNVKGGFNMQSTADIDCSGFKAESGPSNAIQGTFTCDSATSSPKSGVSGTASSSSAKSTGTKGAAASYGVSEAAAGLSVVGSLLQMLL